MVRLQTARPDQPEWGETGSRVRGWCYWHAEQGYGFMRFLKNISPGLWLTDTRHPESPYETAYFGDNALPDSARAASLPSRAHIFEFEVVPSDRRAGLQAVNISLVSKV